MKFLQLFLITAGFALVSWVSAEGILNREYLPAVPVPPRRFLQYPSYHKPQYYNQHQQYYNQYPSYSSPYYPQYSGGYQQQSLGGQFGSGTSLGLNGLGGGYYPNNNLGLLGGLLGGLKPKVDVIDTVYDTNGGYVYGKKK